MGLSAAVPQEILDTIVDELSEDVSSLKKCSLTSTSFLERSRRHIFSHIELFMDHRTAVNFSNLLHKFPHIATHVRHLSIETQAHYGAHSEHTEADKAKHWADWQPSSEKKLVSVLWAVRTFLCSITLTAPHSVGKRWTAIPEILRSALSDTFQSPNIKEIVLRCLSDVAMTTLTPCHQLKRLQCIDVSFSEGSYSMTESGWVRDTRAQSETGSLDSLYIEGISIVGPFIEALTHPHSSLAISSLRHLSIVGRSLHMRSFGSALIKASRKLEHLTWNVWVDPTGFGSEPFVSTPIDFLAIPTLRSFTIKTDLMGDPEVTLQWLSQTLQGSSSFHRLEQLIIALIPRHVNLFYSLNALKSLSAHPSWNIMDEYLAGPRFPHFRAVIIVVPDLVKLKSLPQDRQRLMDQMPLLRNMGKVFVEW